MLIILPVFPSPVSLLACCPQPTTTQKQEPQGLTPNPSVPVVGQDFILSLYPVPHDILSCRWYRGTSTSHPSNLILTYDSQNKAGPIHGPAYTGRESVGPDCSLKIHPFKATDGGAYALTLQTFNGLSEYKIEVSGFCKSLPGYLWGEGASSTGGGGVGRGLSHTGMQ